MTRLHVGPGVSTDEDPDGAWEPERPSAAEIRELEQLDREWLDEERRRARLLEEDRWAS